LYLKIQQGDVATLTDAERSLVSLEQLKARQKMRSQT